MKILKIFGVVVGLHVLALLLIFANPGCSTARKPAPVPGDTVAKEAAPAASVSAALPTPAPAADAPPVVPASAASAPAASTPPLFDPSAPAVAAAPAGADSANSVRFTPTRPGTPVAGALQAEKTADVTPASTYVVRPGDSLWSIAKKHGLTVADLTVANGIAANANLQPGKKLVIPARSGAMTPAVAPLPAAAAKAARPAKSAAPKAAVDGVRHVVKPGESLSVIARNYGLRQSEIALANGISDPARIQAGMELVIPGVAAPKSSKPAAADAKAGGPEATPPAPPVIPVIRIDESPVTPAPKP